MAEAIAGLAVASSIIAVIDATHKVVTTGWKCYKGIRNPPKELLEVMSELMSLHGILEALRSHLYTSHDQNSKDSLALDVLNQPDGVLSVCAVVLQDVRRIIEGLRKKKLSSILAAATNGQKLLEAKSRIERLKGLLMLALSSDHLYVLGYSLLHLCTCFVGQPQFETAIFLISRCTDSPLFRPANHCSDLGHYPMPLKSISTFLSAGCNAGKKKSTLNF